eukprot:6393386-Amphidinium_carterae.2
MIPESALTKTAADNKVRFQACEIALGFALMSLATTRSAPQQPELPGMSDLKSPMQPMLQLVASPNPLSVGSSSFMASSTAPFLATFSLPAAGTSPGTGRSTPESIPHHMEPPTPRLKKKSVPRGLCMRFNCRHSSGRVLK